MKGRLTFSTKYQGKEIYIAFPYSNNWYLFNHDELLQIFLNDEKINFNQSVSWIKGNLYSWNKLSKYILSKLEPHKLIDTNKKALPFDKD